MAGNEPFSPAADAGTSSESLKVSVIIVSYNVRDLLRQTLRSVRRLLADIRAEIIVIDNNSVDESVAVLREEFPGVVIATVNSTEAHSLLIIEPAEHPAKAMIKYSFLQSFLFNYCGLANRCQIHSRIAPPMPHPKAPRPMSTIRDAGSELGNSQIPDIERTMDNSIKKVPTDPIK